MQFPEKVTMANTKSGQGAKADGSDNQITMQVRAMSGMLTSLCTVCFVIHTSERCAHNGPW